MCEAPEGPVPGKRGQTLIFRPFLNISPGRLIIDASSELNPYEAPEPESDLDSDPDPIETDRRASQRRTLIALYAAFAANGASNIALMDNSAAEYVFSLLIALLVTSWAVTDRRLRGGRFIGILRILFFITWPIASLIYLVSTRGYRGLGWWALNAVGAFAVSIVAVAITLLLFYVFELGDVDAFLN